MFTGLIEGLGRLNSMVRNGGFTRLKVEAGSVCEGVKIGDSIAVNGVCLTVAGIERSVFIFDVMLQTLQNTTLKKLKLKDMVNLERALKVGDRLGGHFVTGHIDCVGIIRVKKTSRAGMSFYIAIAPEFLKYVVPRGSVAVDGISLTIAEIKKGGFTVCIIPYTLEKTVLKTRLAGDEVNVELDILVKSVKTPSANSRIVNSVLLW